ncbi:MAG: circadian clock KaiB family protein [Flavitalea sp.]
MKKKDSDSSSPPVPSPGSARLVLKLYITGSSLNSMRSISNLREICEEHFPGRYTLQVIDVYQQPEVASKEQIVALPLLIKKSPGVERRLIGDMSDRAKVLHILSA